MFLVVLLLKLLLSFVIGVVIFLTALFSRETRALAVVLGWITAIVVFIALWN